jgi:hypothetical protein
MINNFIVLEEQILSKQLLINSLKPIVKFDVIYNLNYLNDVTDIIVHFDDEYCF